MTMVRNLSLRCTPRFVSCSYGRITPEIAQYSLKTKANHSSCAILRALLHDDSELSKLARDGPRFFVRYYSELTV